MKIADLDLGEKPLLLAPMEDVTDPSFRYMCKRFGADVVYTEFISSDGLIRDAAKSLKKLAIDDAERPVGIQIYGHLIEPMVEAARMAEAAGPDIIDINFGCPVKKIAGRGAGSGMMRDVPLMVEMTRQIVRAVHKPVTVKTRLGWDDESKNIMEIALRLQDVGIAALTIHGRTRAQMYRGEADWTLIGEVKNNPAIHIPIIGNGDVDSGPKAAAMFDRYGVDGVMIGRGAVADPALLRKLRGGPAVTREELTDFLEDLYASYQDFYGQPATAAQRFFCACLRLSLGYFETAVVVWWARQQQTLVFSYA